MSDKRTSKQRREFLKGALIGSAGAAVAIATGRAAAEQKTEVVSQAPKREARGYRETPHVKQYYKTAEF